MNETNASKLQPTPMTSESSPIIEQVMADFLERAESGRTKYGTYLQAHNGRDALWDAYQEAIDQCMYLRQAIAERDGERPLVPSPPKPPTPPVPQLITIAEGQPSSGPERMIALAVVVFVVIVLATLAAAG